MKSKTKKRITKIIAFSTPLLALGDIYFFSTIGELLTAKSDIAVFTGVLLLCVDIFMNVYLIKFFIQLLKQKSK